MTSTLSAIITVLGAFAAAVALVTTRSWPTALAVLLDLLVAAGLVGLAGGQSLRELAAVVAIVALRMLLRSALLANYQWWRPPERGHPAESVGGRPGTDP
ncbi:hypothetical protein [Micromonospora endophytica]|uniref:Uncharacterized protein n=1 Tax=Micromonospora endophytica TaxID=515350 RepID=A0A2W2BXY0_9ACTN|nr:hypothetical protein [Micromonospora endophytica]PZF90470.1 hypothetical protein C1I93_22690 [Micromonospora endophytica]BCJ56666.1 hypothetical protein Jiend_00880 [Micromonospora endophytica]